MKSGKMHGRGTLIHEYGGGNRRVDGLWRDHKQHRVGRQVYDHGAKALQGVFDYDMSTEGSQMYYKNGMVKKFTNGSWTVVQDVKH